MSKTIKIKEIIPIQQINVVNLSILEIIPPKLPMRINTSDDSVESLMKSIKENGLIYPLCVMKFGEKYEVVAGYRRLIAIKTLGWDFVPCIILTESSDAYFKTMAAENYERKEISLFDEVNFISRLKTELNMSQSQIAKYIGKSTSYINERLAVNDYPNCIIEALQLAQITFSVAREFNKIDDAAVCEQYLHYAIENGCTPVIARRWRQQWELSKEKPDNDTLTQASDNWLESQQVTLVKMKCAGCRDEFDLNELQIVYMCHTCRKSILTS